MGMQIAFWLLSAIAVLAALGVILQRNLFRSALLLVVCFIAVAGIFVTLSADFLAAIHVMINIGAVAILIIMSIMLTQRFTSSNIDNTLRLPAIGLGAILAGAIVYLILIANWPVSNAEPVESSVAALGDILLLDEGFVLLIQMAALLLLTTIIGAIALLKEDR